MKILVVDDEAASRIKMQTLLNTLGMCQAVDNGSEAVRLVEAGLKAGQPFQLITLDIEMPDMDGTEVLQLIRRSEENHGLPKDQRARIIMVTGRADKDKVVACIHNGCDDYIAKPFNIQLVRAKVEKVGLGAQIVNGKAGVAADAPAQAKTMTADSIFEDINRALRKGDLELPAQPEVSIRFHQLVGANADIEEIAATLQKDMVIASKVIRMANSAIYRGFGTVINAAQAIGRIGITATDQLVTALANQQLYATGQVKFKSMLQKLWQHALASAYAADFLAEPVRRQLALDPFVAGLLHDIGALALIQIIAEMEKRRRFSGEISAQALSETVRNFHTAFGSKLLQKWNFSFEYVQTAQTHKVLGNEALNNENAIVHLANLISKAAGYDGVNPSANLELADTLAAKHLHLSNPELNSLIEKTKARMEDSAELAAVG